MARQSRSWIRGAYCVTPVRKPPLEDRTSWEGDYVFRLTVRDPLTKKVEHLGQFDRLGDAKRAARLHSEGFSCTQRLKT